MDDIFDELAGQPIGVPLTSRYRRERKNQSLVKKIRVKKKDNVDPTFFRTRMRVQANRIIDAAFLQRVKYNVFNVSDTKNIHRIEFSDEDAWEGTNHGYGSASHIRNYETMDSAIRHIMADQPVGTVVINDDEIGENDHVETFDFYLNTSRRGDERILHK